MMFYKYASCKILQNLQENICSGSPFKFKKNFGRGMFLFLKFPKVSFFIEHLQVEKVYKH